MDDASLFCFFFFNDTAPTEIYTLSLHDALPICSTDTLARSLAASMGPALDRTVIVRSEEHTSELQSQFHLVCRLLLAKKKHLQHRSIRCTHVVNNHKRQRRDLLQ